MGKRLVVTDGTRERELMVVGRLVVGRDPLCDITYDDALLSRRHAEFVASGDEVIVRDLGSRNGVFVNGERIAERTLSSGDVVQVGPVRARYVADAVPVGTAPEEVDAEYTAIIKHDTPISVAPALSAGPVHDDDDRTRMIQAPRPAPPPPKPPVAPVGDDADKTKFLQPRTPSAIDHASVLADTHESDELASATIVFPKRPPAQPPRVVPTVPPAHPAATPQPLAPSAPQMDASLASYVVVQAMLLAVVVLLGAAVPLMLWRSSSESTSLMWLAVPIAVAAIAAYWTSAQITRRVADAFAAVEQDRR